MNLSKTVFLLFCLLFGYFYAHSQKELVGLIDSKIVKIDSVTGKIELLFSINNIPTDEDVRSLTYDQNKNLFFTIRQSTNNPSLSSISGEGDYSVIGNFKLDGKQIKSVESLAFNNENNKLFASVSLNGGVSDNDFYSEAIVEVDPSTGVCSFVTEISTSAAYPDIDVMTFKENLLFIYDGIPPSGNNYRFYELNLNTVGAISSPDQIYYGTPYLPITDFTSGDKVYIISNRSFYTFNFANNSLQYISQTHSSIEFNGKLITGISIFPPCSLPVVDLGEDIHTCEQDVILNATTPDATYKWQDNSTEPTFTASQSGIYWVDVSNSCGTKRDSIELFRQEPLKIDLGENRESCEPIFLDIASSPGATYEWQDGSNEPYFTASQSGTYWVEVTNACGSVRDTVELLLKNPPSFVLGADRNICSATVLDATFPESAYKWQDGSLNPTFTVDQTGIYWVEVTNACGSTKDTINVVFQNAPLISLGEDREICDPIVLDATSLGATYAWQDGSTDSVFTAKTPGIFWVEVKNSCGIFTDSVQLRFVDIKDPIIPNVFTPNGDQYNQYFQIDTRLEGSKVEIYNRWGRLVFLSDNYYSNWDGAGLARGTYYYKITHPCTIRYKGWISIL